MSTQERARVLSLAVSASGLLAMAGWIFDIRPLVDVGPGLDSMKFVTAACFTFAGLILYALSSPCDDDSMLMQFVLPTSTLLLLIVLVVVFVAQFLDIRVGVERAFVPGPADASGILPVSTTLCFFLLAAAGEIRMIRPPGMRVALRGIGLFVGAVGIHALAGYAAGVPMLYFEIAPASSAMSLPAAVLFVACGAAVVSCAARERSFV